MEVKVFNQKQLLNLIYDSGLPKKQYSNLTEDIRFFSYDDLSSCFMTTEFKNSLRFIVAFDEKVIYGIAKIAIFGNSKECISCSYLSVNINFRNLGISKMIVDTMIEYITNEPLYLDLLFSMSGFTPSGYKYLRKNIINKCNELGLNFIDNVVKYEDKVNGELILNEEYYKLREESIAEFKKLYPLECIN